MRVDIRRNLVHKQNVYTESCDCHAVQLRRGLCWDKHQERESDLGGKKHLRLLTELNYARARMNVYFVSIKNISLFFSTCILLLC